MACCGQAGFSEISATLVGNDRQPSSGPRVAGWVVAGAGRAIDLENMQILRWLSLGLASGIAGAINSVAGGGTLVSFPAAMAMGLPPVVANATNTVALVPGTLASAFAYRRELLADKRHLVPLLFPSLVGGLLGAALVLVAPEKVFEAIVPWLVFGATLLILLKHRISKHLGAKGPPSRTRVVAAGIGIFLMGVYGGYFGAGIGIITLAVLSLMMPLDIHTMNARKSVLASVVNGAAAGLFIIRGTANLPMAAVMALGSIGGGYFGARLARRVPVALVSGSVVAIGLLLTGILLFRGVGIH